MVLAADSQCEGSNASSIESLVEDEVTMRSGHWVGHLDR